MIRPVTDPVELVVIVAGPPVAMIAGPLVAESPALSRIVDPVPEVTLIPDVPPVTVAPALVVTRTAHWVLARIAAPVAEVTGAVAEMLMSAQPVAVATIPLEPGPVIPNLREADSL